MKDIGLELQKSIETAFDERLAIDVFIKAIKLKVENGKATQRDVTMLCKRLGEIASKVLIENIKPEMMPNDKMYWNIAEKAIKPLMKKIHGIVNKAAAEVVMAEHKANGIHIKPIEPVFPKERIESLINNFVNAYNVGIEEYD
ncbi:MAG: hypothetical protein HXL85_05505 [[Eubacterium] sulci]|nr:hypothetical protein [[Eubacterium] sulci]